MTHIKHIFIAAVLTVSALSAHAVELMTWQRVPLAVPLTVGQERIIFIDRNVRIGMDSSLQRKLRVQSASGTIYLLAHDSIPPSRLQIQDMESGEIILLDIATVPGDEALEPVRIIGAEPVAPARSDDDSDTGAHLQDKAAQTPVPVLLTRHASQNLYAPLRTIEPVPGIRKVSLRAINTETLMPLHPVQTTPLAAWRSGDFFVTAVRLTNQSKNTLQLDPRKLQGDFYAATFQHNFIGTAGTDEDTTVVYLVTRGAGLEKALLPAETADEVADEVTEDATGADDEE